MEVVISTLKSQIPKVYTRKPRKRKEKQKERKKKRKKTGDEEWKMGFKKEDKYKLILVPIQERSTSGGKKNDTQESKIETKKKKPILIVITMIKDL